MLRLAHRILSQQTLIPPVVDPRGHAAYLQRYQANKALLAQPWCKIIVADNVAEYYADTPRQEWALTGENFPCIAPPFQQAWFIEWKEPDHLVGPKGIVQQTNRLNNQAGNLFLNLPLATARDLGQYYKAEAVFDEVLPDAKWLLLTYCFVTTATGQVVYLPVMHAILVSPVGKLLRSIALCDTLTPGTPTTQRVLERSQVGLHIPLLALGFMHCKNVDRVDVTAEEGPPPKWCRRQRVPEKCYHVLQIDPNLGHLKATDERKTEGDRSGNSLHICRGHFVHYIDDGVSKGLFGRYIFGIFWIPSHARGSMKHGEIKSTYTVKAPCNS